MERTTYRDATIQQRIAEKFIAVRGSVPVFTPAEVHRIAARVDDR